MALVEQHADSGVSVITLNRPEKRNAVTPELQLEFESLLRQADADDSVCAVIVTGTGDYFCAGGDFTVIERMIADESVQKDLAAGHARTAEHLLSLSKPTIAAVNGPALGFGAELAAFCDMAVMSENAYLCDPHIRFGLGPAPGTLLVWPQLTSRAIAAELLLTGREVHAEEALRLGLVNRVAPEGEALSAAVALARQICALPREGVLAAKRALRRSYAELLAEFAGDIA